VTDRDRAGDQPTPPRSRLEDEVLEILVRTEQPTSLGDHVRRKAQQQRRTPFDHAARSLPSFGTAGPGVFLVACLALALLASLVRESSALLATLLVLASVASLAMVAVRRHGGAGGSNVKTWRGRDLDFGPPSPAWVESLRDRFRRPPRL
jgi:hypothetical protein